MAMKIGQDLAGGGDGYRTGSCEEDRGEGGDEEQAGGGDVQVATREGNEDSASALISGRRRFCGEIVKVRDSGGKRRRAWRRERRRVSDGGEKRAREVRISGLIVREDLNFRRGVTAVA
ncbi:hypothetical protein S83_017666 [Arachis hypogaea]